MAGMNHNKLRWVAVYFIVFLIIALCILTILYYTPRGLAYYGMNWVWEIA